MTKRITKVVMIATAALIILWDIYVAVEPTPGDTISEVLLGWAMQHPIIPFAIGVVCGHLFWPQGKGEPPTSQLQ